MWKLHFTTYYDYYYATGRKLLDSGVFSPIDPVLLPGEPFELSPALFCSSNVPITLQLNMFVLNYSLYIFSFTSRVVES